MFVKELVARHERLNMINVSDVVEATLLALENEESGGEIFNVCTGKPITINKLVQLVKEVTGKDLHMIYDKPRKGDIKNNYEDPTKTKKILGFETKINLKKSQAMHVMHLNDSGMKKNARTPRHRIRKAPTNVQAATRYAATQPILHVPINY